jgi:hemolysin III
MREGFSIRFGIAGRYITQMHNRDELIPILRGVSHAVAVPLALAGAAVLVAVAQPGTARAAAVVYGAGLCVLFTGSALFHRLRCSPRVRGILARIDHSAIYLFMAASFTPIALIVLDGWGRQTVFGLVWTGALGGVVLSLAWVTAPRLLFTLTYLALGWVMLIAFPQLIPRMETAPLLLFLAGGLLYSAGAVVYATRRPDPWPRTFGFHEVFHALVIAGAVTHFVAMAGWVIPAA